MPASSTAGPAARARRALFAALALATLLAGCASAAPPPAAPVATPGPAADAAPRATDAAAPDLEEAELARLREALRRYRAIAAAGGWPAVPEGPKLELGVRSPRVALLRQRLQASGDLAAGNAEDDRFDDRFDAGLDAAVRRFQARHGLAVDGVVGPRSLAALGVPVARRVAALELNLRRLAARAGGWGERYLAVNAAAARYRVVEDGAVVLERRAVVGRPDWPTPALEGLIDRLELNPSWTVPPRIARLELLPKIRKDPGYLARHDMRWVDGLLRQAPGPDNPLGRVKFLFDNPYSVYLHDTSAPRLFERAERFLSHGCVRVEDALELARLLLRGDPAWPAGRLEAVVGSGETLRVELPRPMPLYIVYLTAWVEPDGTVNFRDDPYGRDREAASASAAGPEGCPDPA